MLKKVIVSVCGILAGFVNGLLGTGGGILIIYTLNLLYPCSDPRDNFASAIACILPMSVVSAGFYLQRGSYTLNDVTIYIVPAIIGGVAGALLLNRIKVNVLKKIFACIVIYAGISMVL